MDEQVLNRIRGVAVGAAVGDALGMPLEFMPRRRNNNLVTDMMPGRIVAGSFTDDTEMALALAESILACGRLDPLNLSFRFVRWMQSNPPDIGNHTRSVLQLLADGVSWNQAAVRVQHGNPSSAGNGSVMRCWPIALARWNDSEILIQESIMQSLVTHSHQECTSSCAFVNATISYLLNGVKTNEAINKAKGDVDLPDVLHNIISQSSRKTRDQLPNTGWIRHTVESVVWALLTTHSFENAVIQVVNLGSDADTAGTVIGALAGAAYGLDAIPLSWRMQVKGEYPLGSGTIWGESELIKLADALADFHKYS